MTTPKRKPRKKARRPVTDNDIRRTLLDRVDDRTVSFCARIWFLGITLLMLHIDFADPINTVSNALADLVDARAHSRAAQVQTVETPAPTPPTISQDDLALLLAKIQQHDQVLEQLLEWSHPPGRASSQAQHPEQ